MASSVGSIRQHFKSKLPPDSERGSPIFGNPPIGFHPVMIAALDFTAAVAPVEVLVRLMGQRALEFLFGEIEVIGPEFSIVREPRPRDRQMPLSRSNRAIEAQN